MYCGKNKKITYIDTFSSLINIKLSQAAEILRTK